jgi:hypothetical protein
MVPLAVVAATALWNGVLTQVVTIVGPINVWQMAGLMLLWYIMYPGTKPKINTKNEE